MVERYEGSGQLETVHLRDALAEIRRCREREEATAVRPEEDTGPKIQRNRS